MMLNVLWQIWKARNALTFDAVDTTVTGVLRSAIKDTIPWTCQYKEDRALVIAWTNYF
jgi:hypothetical protein